MRDRKEVDLGGREGGEELEVGRGRGSCIQIMLYERIYFQ